MIKFNLYLDADMFQNFVLSKLRACDRELATSLLALHGPLFVSNLPEVALRS